MAAFSRHFLGLSKVLRSAKGARLRTVQVCKHYRYRHSIAKPSYFHAPGGNIEFIYKTVGGLFNEIAEQYPDREAFYFKASNERITFTQFKTEVDKLAAGFLELGVKRGDRIGIWGQNSLEWAISTYAAAKIGAIAVCINFGYTSAELEYCLNKVGVKALISSSKFKDKIFYENILEVNPQLTSCKPGQLKNPKVPSLESVIMMGDKKWDGTFSFNEILEAAGSEKFHEAEKVERNVSPDDPFCILLTSGTTGKPKGATLTHFGCLNNLNVFSIVNNFEKFGKMLMVAPFFHVIGLFGGVLLPSVMVSSVVFPSDYFDALKSIKSFHEDRCTQMIAVPTMYMDIVNHPERSKYDMSSFKTGVSGGSMLLESAGMEIKEALGVELQNCYGLTETSGVSHATPKTYPLNKKFKTCGLLIPSMEHKIVDSEGRIVPVGTPGEIWIRGYSIMLGYWNDPEKTAETIDKAGWLKSGDMAIMDEDNSIQIVGRIKDMIIRGGENIQPTEIEDVIFEHPKIEDVQIIGVPDKRLGEEVCAVVKLNPGKTVEPKEIREFCKNKLASFKIPKYVIFVSEYPMTISGKVKKFELRKSATKELKLDNV